MGVHSIARKGNGVDGIGNNNLSTDFIIIQEQEHTHTTSVHDTTG
jgi:hypothetical protein